MKKRITALILALLLICSVLPAASATKLVPCMTVDDTLLLIGDSNTVALQNYNSDLTPARMYARVNGVIAETVENWSRYPAYGYDKGIYQLLCELSGDEFRTVVINMGTNNLGTNLTKFRGYYAQLLQNLYEKNPDAVIYVCKILPTNPANCSGDYVNLYTPANVAKINSAVLEVYEEYLELGYDVRVLDFNTPFADSSGVLLSAYDNGGGVHLNARGYKKMDEILQTVVSMGDPNQNHSWPEEGETVIPPTCSSTGLMEYVCTVCGAVRNEEIPANDAHVWDEGVTVLAPGCTEPGVKRCTCTLCGEATQDFPVPALGHAWSFTKLVTEGDSAHACSALYTCSRCNETKTARLCAAEVFTDMPAEGNWAHDPIDWAYFNGITAGKSPTTFNPKDTVTRAEAMTFLWKTLDSPEPGTTENPFEDVMEGKYYYKPVLWAVENGVTTGTSETTFSPKQNCTRAQILTFLWIAAGKPEPETEENPFTDVQETKYYYKAVLWGVENHITSGVAPDEFGPNQTCTRAQIVAFLYLAKDQMPQAPDTP